MNTANLIIYASKNGRDGWEPVLPDSVPEWVKDPDTLGRMVAGDMAFKPNEGDKGSMWYRAEKAE